MLLDTIRPVVTISRFRVDRMDCVAEEQLVRMRLDGLDGVAQVAVDLAAREVTVEHTLDRRTIETALEELDLGTAHLGDGGAIAPLDGRRERRGLQIALTINAGLFVAELAFGAISRSMGRLADGRSQAT